MTAPAARVVRGVRAALLLGSVGCVSSAETEPNPPVTASTGPPAAAADCAGTANPLVFRCAVSLAAPGPAAVAFTAPGAPTRVFTDPVVAVDHALTAWGLLPDTRYHWESGEFAGDIVTGSVPDALAGLHPEVTGALFGADAVLVATCGTTAMVDGSGRVVWYADAPLTEDLRDGVRWSPDDAWVLTLRDAAASPDPPEVRAVDLAGDEVLRLTSADLGLRATHDLDRWHGNTYVLGETDEGIGGFEVFRGTERLGEWRLTDSFPEVDLLGLAHVNGLSVSESGEVIVSALGFSAAIAVDGDPDSPTFLQLAWHAYGGSGPALPAPDYVPAAGVAFLGQHNASRSGDALWVFDNGGAATARAVRFRLDPAGVLAEEASWATGLPCPNQGGALPLAGGALVTCANAAEAFAFRDGEAEPAWYLSYGCGPGGGTSSRAYPVAFP